MKTKPMAWIVGGVLLLAVTLMIWNVKGTQMARASDYVIDRNYYVIVHAQGAAYDVFINGITTKKENDIGSTSFNLPINHLMQSDINRVTFNFSPTELKYDEFGKVIVEPNSNFFIHISIESVHLKTRERERITLVDARYDMEAGQIVSNEKTIFDTDPVYRQPHMQTTGELKLKSNHVWVNHGLESPIPSQHLIAEFRISDRFPRFHWLDEAVVLEDTPKLRREVRDAYRYIHRLIESGDFGGMRRIMEPGWKNAAISLNMGNSADDFIHSVEPYKGYVKRREDGRILQPLHFDQLETPLELDHLQFMADGRVVRLLPDPIQWERPGATHTTFSRFVFYMNEEGVLMVADIVL
ncbi:hypothetical protein [Nitrincola alkalisediminis]|uniref:hypothetical protein n=1 Tax=Nitrincola alkalisediminis TaxID=1366656 RepID=UPI001873C60E|nr:hypothetical protein [Nitrincola alkalisediminis]